jgi:hypothetical protein
VGSHLSRLPGDGDHQVSRHPVLHVRDADQDRGANLDHRGATDGNDNDRLGATDDNQSRLAADHHHRDDHDDYDHDHDHQPVVWELLHDGAVI